MKLKQLNEIITKTLSFSDLQMADNWDAKFWLNNEEAIKAYKEQGPKSLADYIVSKIEKIGETNYNAMVRNSTDLGIASFPKFEQIVSKTYWMSNLKGDKKNSLSAVKLIALFTLIKKGIKIRKADLEKRIEELQNELSALD